jgi:hypothetical protein
MHNGEELETGIQAGDGICKRNRVDTLMERNGTRRQLEMVSVGMRLYLLPHSDAHHTEERRGEERR